MIQEFRTFIDRSIATAETVEREQEKRHEQNARKLDEIMAKTSGKSLWWTIAGAVFTFAGVIIAILAILITIKVARTSNLRDLLHSTNAPTYADAPRISTVPQE